MEIESTTARIFSCGGFRLTEQDKRSPAARPDLSAARPGTAPYIQPKGRRVPGRAEQNETKRNSSARAQGPSTAGEAEERSAYPKLCEVTAHFVTKRLYTARKKPSMAIEREQANKRE